MKFSQKERDKDYLWLAVDENCLPWRLRDGKLCRESENFELLMALLYPCFLQQGRIYTVSRFPIIFFLFLLIKKFTFFFFLLVFKLIFFIKLVPILCKYYKINP